MKCGIVHAVKGEYYYAIRKPRETSDLGTVEVNVEVEDNFDDDVLAEQVAAEARKEGIPEVHNLYKRPSLQRVS